MSSILALIIANMPAFIKIGKEGFDFVMFVRKALKQSGEWTDADEAAFTAKLDAQAIDPAWQMDAPTAKPE